jgi:hypothetical protein
MVSGDMAWKMYENPRSKKSLYSDSDLSRKKDVLASRYLLSEYGRIQEF